MSKKQIMFFGASIMIMTLSTTSCNRPSVRPPADMILINGNILADASEMTRFEALAVKGDTILALGTRREIEKYQDKNTRVIDAGGKLVLPGLIDSHVHFLLGGIGLRRDDNAIEGNYFDSRIISWYRFAPSFIVLL